MPEVVLGVPEIDDQLIIRGAQSEEVKQILLEPKDPMAFVNLCQEHQFNGIKESFLHITPTKDPTADELRAVFDRLAVFASDFDHQR